MVLSRAEQEEQNGDEMSGSLVIIGATGKKSGGAFVKKLRDHIDTIQQMFPDGVRAIARPSSNTSQLRDLLPDCMILKGSLEDVPFLRTAMDGADTLVHIAGIHWSKQVVTAAAASGVRRVIVVHTTGIYSKYKRAGEEYRQIDAYVERTCRENGIVLTILRPTMIYGNAADQNLIRFIRMVDRLPLMAIVNRGTYPLQPVHYLDLAAAYYSVLIHEDKTAGKAFVLSGESPILLREMLRVIGQGLGKRVRFFSVPFPLAYAGAWLVYCFTIGRIDYREKVQRLCEPRAYPHDEAAAAFGYTPRPFHEGILREIEEYKAGKSV